MKYYPYICPHKNVSQGIIYRINHQSFNIKNMYLKTKKNAFVAMFAWTFLSVPAFAQTFNTLGTGAANN